MAAHVRDLIREIRPDQVECVNEFWYTKGSADVRMRQYRDWIYEFAKGCSMANWDGLLIGSTVLDPGKDSAHDLWML